MTSKKKNVDYQKMVKTLSKNYWAISTVVLALLLIGLLLSGGASGPTVSAQEAGQNLLSFANAQGAEAELISSDDSGQFYEVVLSIDGQQVPLYVTKDGKSFTQQLVSLDSKPTTTQTQQPAAKSYTEEDLTKIKEFSQCLADKGVKAYGAGWCGYCKKLKETFGGDATTGAEVISPFYIECQNADRTPTEHANTCTEEEIRGFPTIKLNGEASGLSALSSLEEFATTTGCTLPTLSN